ncbi:MAG: translation initiation factor IF-6 [Candidatus Aenigmarchaeota archaeon]|nr:translation initiation factor IF-6 [Candidatus Aenigmarchaeota archaeon]
MILQMDFDGDVNIGIFGVSNNEIVLLGSFVRKSLVKKIEEVLDVEVVKISVSNTDFIGLMCIMNSNGIILPKTVEDFEIKKIKKITKQYGINLLVLKSKYTALGNLILANDKGAIVSPLFTKKEKKEIENTLGVKTAYGKISKLSIPGSCGIANNNGALVHHGIYGREIKKIERILEVEVVAGTINSGTPYVKSGVIANDKGAIVGSISTGPEISNLMDALKLL